MRNLRMQRYEKNEVNKDMLKKITLLFSGIVIVLLFAYPVLVFSAPIKTIVIDAGHGGHDPGAIGVSNSFEKDVVLDVVLRLGKQIETNYPDIKVIYTRKTDVFVELNKRADIANKNHADLFISIHCNSSSSGTACGAETFVMGVDKTNANMALVQKENSVILKEDNYENNYGGFDPYSPESYVIFSLLQNAYLAQSTHFAANIQKSFANDLKRNDRGVKQAPFLVLWKTTMPSVLVELGFLSNKSEEAYLLSEKGKEELSNSIYTAIVKLINEKSNTEVTVKSEPDTKDTSKTEISNKSDEQFLCYKVQFATVSKQKDLNDYAFKGLPEVQCHKNGKYFTYTAGMETTLEAAEKVLEIVRNKGYKDAFIIALLNGKRISVDKAKSLNK